MPQNEYMERFQKQHGRRLDYEERKRKRIAREGHNASEKAQNLRGLRAKQYAETRRKEKIQMKQSVLLQLIPDVENAFRSFQTCCYQGSRMSDVIPRNRKQDYVMFEPG